MCDGSLRREEEDYRNVAIVHWRLQVTRSTCQQCRARICLQEMAACSSCGTGVGRGSNAIGVRVVRLVDKKVRLLPAATFARALLCGRSPLRSAAGLSEGLSVSQRQADNQPATAWRGTQNADAALSSPSLD
jgi:hypothetical protein